MPVLINKHVHANMMLVQRYADDRRLSKKLQKFVWPLSTGLFFWLQFCIDGTLLKRVEMVHRDVTYFTDTYFSPDAGASTVLSAANFVLLGLLFIVFPIGYASTADEQQECGHQTY